VSVSLTPGYIVLMTPSGTIRKIKVSEDLIDEEPEVLQLRLGASASLLDETHGSG
jgi:DNA-binding protein YbaB